MSEIDFPLLTLIILLPLLGAIIVGVIRDAELAKNIYFFKVNNKFLKEESPPNAVSS